MKKLLLSLLVIFGIQWASAGQFVYGVCGDEISGVGTGMGGSNYSAAIEVPESVAKALEGSKVTAVSIGFKSGLAKIINVYLTYDLQGEPFYKQEGRVKVNTFNDVALDTPYIIEGRRFYIGYTYRQSSSTGFPIGYDAQNMGGMPAFSHMALWPDDGTPEWGVYPQYGALSIRATIEGDKTLDNCVIPVGLALPKSTGLGKQFDIRLSVLNYGSKAISKVGTVVTLGNGAPVETECQLDSPLKPGERTTVTLTASTSIEDRELPVTVGVPTVDGADNLWASLPASGMMISSDFVSPRVVVIEEATGTGCGYCPAGYVALEQMREKYPEDYIGIAVHNYSGDPMFCASYEPWVNKYITGFPNATISRSPRIGVFSPSVVACEANYKELEGVLNVHFDIESEYTDDTRTALRTRTTFIPGYDMEDSSYAIALVETEDNVGPYNQRNNYSGGGSGAMYGFEDLGGWVSLMYNDVARAIYNWLGNPASLPSSMEKYRTYRYEETIPVVTAPGKLADANFIALLIDRSTGEIVTAAKCKPGRIGSGVGHVTAASAAVRPVAGGILLSGSFDSAEVFGVDGSLRASASAEGRVSLPAGIYVVRIHDGADARVSKVIVK